MRAITGLHPALWLPPCETPVCTGCTAIDALGFAGLASDAWNGFSESREASGGLGGYFWMGR